MSVYDWWDNPVEAFLKEKDMRGYSDDLATVISNKRRLDKEDKDMDKLVKAIKADYEWANETSVIFENEMPDIFQSPEQKAFLNGVKFATRKYMEIIQEMEESND